MSIPSSELRKGTKRYTSKFMNGNSFKIHKKDNETQLRGHFHEFVLSQKKTTEEKRGFVDRVIPAICEKKETTVRTGLIIEKVGKGKCLRFYQ